MIDWRLGLAPDVGGAFQKGMEAGQRKSALAGFAANPNDPTASAALLQSDPQAYVTLRQNARQDATAEREQRFRMAARNALLPANAPAANQPNALMPATQVTQAPRPMAAAPIISAPDAQAAPPPMPAEVDGLRINPAAMRELYSIDPEAALKYQTALGQANREQLKTMQDHGVWLAKTAYYLTQFRTPDGQPDIEARRAAAMQILPDLQAKGIDANALGQFGFGDDELNRFVVFGQSLGQIIDDDRQDRRLEADVADDQADNARADREAESRDRYRQGRIEIGKMPKRPAQRQGKKNKGGKPAKAGKFTMTATNPETGAKIGWNGSEWVAAE